MRVMVILKANKNSETSTMPSTDVMERSIRFNEEMMQAGILKSADALKPSSAGKRIQFRPHRRPSITDGPFAETKELVAGYCIWEVKSMEEAMEWALRIPDPAPGLETTIEIRPFYGPEDFAQALTPDQMERVDEMHRHEAAQQN